ncbi:MAG: PAN/Apple domain-containing protein [Hyphomicrobiaceae bacterium]
MRQLLLALSAVFVFAGIGTAHAQGEICPVAGARPFHPTGKLGRSFKSDNEARDIVVRIKGVLGIADEITTCMSDAPDYDNAHAFVTPADKRRYIVFSQKWMNDLRAATSNYWSLIGIAAHEVGHHAARHELTPSEKSCDLNHIVELYADYYSGLALGKLGAKEDDAVSAMRQMPILGGCSHPDRARRVAMAQQGWREATSTPVSGTPIASADGPAPGVGGTGQAATGRGAAPRSRGARGRAAVTIAHSDGKLASRAVEALKQVTTSYPALDRFRVRNNRDVQGHDIARVIGVTIGACADACEKNASCKGFSFDRWNGWCFLKDAMPASVLDPASTIGVRRGVEFPNVITIEHEMLSLRRRKFVDTPLRVLADTDAAACSAVCDKELACVAYTAERSEKKCRLFRQTEGHFADDDFDSGFKRQIPRLAGQGRSGRTRSGRSAGGGGAITLAREDGLGFAGTGYDRHEDASYADCEALCRRDGRCKALEHVTRTKVCRLYESVGNKKPADGSAIAIKGGA